MHEAAERIGGRCWTVEGVFAEGQVAEHGGELIDSDHTRVRALVGELGLTLDNVLAGESPGTDDLYYLDRADYPPAEARADYLRVQPAIHRDLLAAPYPTLYDHHTPAAVRLDNTSIAQWIEDNVPGGRASKFGQLLDLTYNTEFGADTADQSALNLIYLLGYSPPRRLHLIGASNEKFHVRGGNGQMVTGLADRLPGQIERDSELVAIALEPDGGYSLTLRQGARSVRRRVDQVVLALPFTILRRSVDFSRAGFSPRKRTAIEEMGMGTNSKLQLQFSDRHWRREGCNGSTYADTGYQSTWEVTRAQPGRAGILVDYTGGTIGDSFGTGTTEERARRFLAQIEPAIPGLSRRYNGRATLNFWADYPWTLGSYAYYRVGQATRFSGIERRPSGRCHFAGEHTSITFQGYLEGAVRSGERAAREVLAQLR